MKPATKDYYLNGDISPGVKTLQAGLVKAGYKLAVDGVFGNGTETAVKSFQKANGLSVDGVWGKASQAKLDTVLVNLNKPAASKPPKPPTQKPAAKSNDPSDWAKVAVEKAKELGISDGTRLHDPVTREEAIVLAMRAAGLAPRTK